MSVATDLQDVLADLSAAIAGNKNYGRVELEKLRRSLNATAKDARQQEHDANLMTIQAEGLVEAIDRGVIDLGGVAARARRRLRLPDPAATAPATGGA